MRPRRRSPRLYADRWTIETAFQHLTVDLACEVDTLGYPKAALFGFCVALVAYNVVALVKGALRAAHGAAYVEEQLSMYYLTLEVAQVATGMEIALGAEPWEIFRQMSTAEFATTLVAIAQRLDTKKYTKHKRGSQEAATPQTQWQAPDACLDRTDSRDAKVINRPLQQKRADLIAVILRLGLHGDRGE